MPALMLLDHGITVVVLARQRRKEASNDASATEADEERIDLQTEPPLLRRQGSGSPPAAWNREVAARRATSGGEGAARPATCNEGEGEPRVRQPAWGVLLVAAPAPAPDPAPAAAALAAHTPATDQDMDLKHKMSLESQPKAVDATEPAGAMKGLSSASRLVCRFRMSGPLQPTV